MNDGDRADQYLSYYTILKIYKMEANQLCFIQFLSTVQVAEHRINRLKYKSFLLEVSDYWEGMTLEEIHEDHDIEATDEDDDPSTPTAHAPIRETVGGLSGGRQLVELGK
jgi:hypothetical protein